MILMSVLFPRVGARASITSRYTLCGDDVVPAATGFRLFMSVLLVTRQSPPATGRQYNSRGLFTRRRRFWRWLFCRCAATCVVVYPRNNRRNYNDGRRAGVTDIIAYVWAALLRAVISAITKNLRYPMARERRGVPPWWEKPKRQ